MRTEAVRAQLAAHGLGDRYREFTVSSATVALAAEALHCEAGRIAKTLSILTSTGPVLVVAMGLARLDNRKFKDLFHEKARFIPVEDVERLTGHPQGGVCPFALPEGVRVFLDESLKNTGSGGNELTWNDRSMTSEDIGGTIYFPSVLGDSFDVVAVAFDADKLPGKMVSATVTFPSSLDPASVAMKIPTSSVVRSYKQITALQLMNRTSHLTRYDLK